jgi:hypothetical protein
LGRKTEKAYLFFGRLFLKERLLIRGVTAADFERVEISQFLLAFPPLVFANELFTQREREQRAREGLWQCQGMGKACSHFKK